MGTVFAIKKYAIHDGPNIRTTVFLKGCPLSCWWCHNPEGMPREITMLWNHGKCVTCNECIEKCPSGALHLEKDGIVRDDQRCVRCSLCSENCPSLAHEATGWEASVADIMTEIKKDIPFYDQSGGGVTFSGGEPLMQPQFLLELLKDCGRLDIHRAVDTCAFAETETLLKVARHTEMFLFDLKVMDSARHKQFTGVANELILKNIRLVADSGKRITIRIPLIEGVNCDDDNINKSGAFIKTLPGVEHVDLLPYHGIATAKYRKLGLEYAGSKYIPVDKERVAHCATLLTEWGLKVQVGG